MPNAVPAEDFDPGALTTDCEPPFAFDGDASIAELGLGPALPGVEGQLNIRGRIRITRDTVRAQDFLPPGAPALVEEGQLLCMTFDDGSGMSLMLPVPFPLDGGAGTARIDVDWALMIVIGLAAIAIIGVSWMAFRRSAA